MNGQSHRGRSSVHPFSISPGGQPASGRRGAGRDARADVDAYLGAIIFLGTWAMLFAALFFAYGVVRVQSVSWPPPGEPWLPRALPGLNTLLLLSSSLLLRRGLAADRRGRPGALERALRGTIALGAIFLAAQIGIWHQMTARGLTPRSGIYGSVFFALTGFHALHVLSGLLALVVLAVRHVRHARRATAAAIGTAPPTSKTLAADRRGLRVAALFWDFIAVVWLLMYLTIYLL